MHILNNLEHIFKIVYKNFKFTYNFPRLLITIFNDLALNILNPNSIPGSTNCPQSYVRNDL